jgi:hypothetical protein
MFHVKSRPKCSPIHTLSNVIPTFFSENRNSKGHFSNESAQKSERSPKRRKFAQSDWDRCYDHNFLRFLTIFGEKIGVFLKNQCYGQIFA